MSQQTNIDVLKQAIIEYLTRRHCHEDNLDHTLEGLKIYVNERYGSHEQHFKDDKFTWLIPRITAAWTVLKNLREVEQEQG